MINLAPKETKSETLPEPIQNLVLSNETLGSLDIDIEIENQTMKVTLTGIYLGKTPEPTFENSKKKWILG